MKRIAEERRESPRFDLRLTLRYRLSQKGEGEDRWQTGVTRDMSKNGVGFKARRPLPVGCHIELRIDWPARYNADYPVDLQATGFVIRSDQHRTAVRISSHRFLVNNADNAELSKTA
jgi:PilZ domain